MKIAVPITSDNQIDSHFGHCDSYKVFSVSEKKEITDTKIIQSPQGCGCKSDIASILANDGVKIMLAGGIGGGAINVLYNNGIEVIRGCSGDASETVKQFISGMITDSRESCHQHEHHQRHGHGHECDKN